MKKFLTVLLALSVVFTYTVGTAFAAAPTAQQKTSFETLVDQAASKVKGDFNTNYIQALELLDATTELSGGFTTDLDTWKKAAALYKTAQETAIADRAQEMKDLYAGDADTFEAGIETNSPANLDKIIALFKATKSGGNATADFKTAAVAEYATVADVKTAIEGNDEVKAKAAEYEFDAKKTAAQQMLANIDLSMYSTKIQTIGNVQTSYYAMAQAFLAGEVAKLNAIVLDATDTGVAAAAPGKIAGKVADIKAITDQFETDSYGNFIIKAATNTAQGLVTISDEKDENYDLAIAKNTALNVMNGHVNTYLTTNKNAAAIQLTDAYKKVWTYLINEAKTETELEAAAGVGPAYATIAAVATKQFVASVKDIAELEDYAAKYKLEKDASGNLVRDAKKVDDVVEAATLAAYKAALTDVAWSGLSGAKNDIRDNCYVTSAKSKYVVDKKKADIEAARKAMIGDDKYYAPELAAVNAIYDDLLAKVENAKDDTEVNAVSVSLADASAGLIKTKVSIENLIKSYAAYKTDLAKLEGYMEYVNHGLKKTDDAYRDFSGYDLAAFYAENGVRANADITADLYSKAEADVKAVKTNKETATAKTAAEALIAALPTTITVGDKAAVEAAWKAAAEYNKYGKAALSNQAKLETAVTGLFNAERRAANRLYTALPSTLTIADKAAVKAFGDALKAIDDNIGTDKIYAAKAGAIDADIANYVNSVKAIKALELKAVTDAVNALPLNITLNDKAAVEAARKLFDAYVEEYTVLTAGDSFAWSATAVDAATEINNRSDLFMAEAEIAALEKAENERIKAGVKATTIKIYSKAYKKYTKISWKKSLGFKVDGYEIYRSTKKNTGFKKIWTAKSTAKSVKNTKNLISGKKYYYYAKGFRMIDGEKVYTKKSITIYRTAK